MANGCVVCCTFFGGIGAVLLTLFGLLFTHRNISLVVTGSKHNPQWDLDAKARACFVGAAIYAGLSLLCGGLVMKEKLCKKEPHEDMEVPLMDRRASTPTRVQRPAPASMNDCVEIVRKSE